MLVLNDYVVEEKIKESRNSIVYRGRKKADDVPVIIKWHYQNESGYERNLRALKNELELIRRTDSVNIVRAYEVLENREGCGLIVEDFGGRSLREVMGEGKIELEVLLSISVVLADALAQVHEKNIIHKDVNPGNIIVNPSDWTVKLADFGIASLLSREEQAIISLERLEGTLAYISPEQTGRMNRSIDYRTDIYSLGVSFYEMLCGQLPFRAKDAVGWVHNHIAVAPAPLQDVDPNVPVMLNKIVLKMLEKNAEDRYQSVHGVKADLEECLQRLKLTRHIEEFELGGNDFSGRFHIPQKLYGREPEIQKLMSEFDSVAKTGATEMLLVAGYSGIGKSVLVKEVHKPIVEQRGYFIAGKYDQFKRNIPYSAVIHAFQELVSQIISENDEQLKDWRNKLTSALGDHAEVIIDVIPEVELIMGKQSPVPELGPLETQIRFNITFQKFIRVFAQEEHPLVMFLDDLQWADAASLSLVNVLMTDPANKYLFLIGAYRDNEVDAAHPFVVMLKELREQNLKIEMITLSPLELDDVVQLVGDSLKTDKENSKSLATLVMEKTQGNPFFVNEFLKTIASDGLLNFDFTQRKWTFNEDEIQAREITTNVVELMVGRMKKMPEKTQQALQLAACIGNIFDLKTLSIVLEEGGVETALALGPAITEGMLIPMGFSRELFKNTRELEEGLSTTRALKAVNKFLHDRVQQAAYAMIEEEQKKKIHLKIARMLLENSSKEELEESLFDVVGHYNEGVDLLEDSDEKIKLAELNLRVALKAKASSAYKIGLVYLKVSMALLGDEDEAWKTRYELMRDVYREATEMAYLVSEYDYMEELMTVVMARVELLDKVRVYEIRIQAYVARNRLNDAVKTGIDVLKLLGAPLPDNANFAHIGVDLIRTKIALWGKSPESMLELPEMTDPYKLAAMRLLAVLFTPVFWTNQNLVPLLVFSLVRLSIRYGVTPASTFGFVLYGGPVTSGVLGDLPMGRRFGDMALMLSKKIDHKDKFFYTKTVGAFYIFVSHWTEELRECLKPYLEAFRVGGETGDLEYGSHCALWYCLNLLLMGEDLAKTNEEFQTYGRAMKQNRQGTDLNYQNMMHQVALNLMGEAAENPAHVVGEKYNEDEMAPLHLKQNDRTALSFLYSHKLQLAFLFEDYSRAAELIKLAKTYMDALEASPYIPLFHFYISLLRLNAFPELKSVIRKVKREQKKMRKWMKSSPLNYTAKYYIVEGELARLQGRNIEAMEFYRNAIEAGRENKSLSDEALANELFAKYWIKDEINVYAELHMTEARRLYRRWGALGKVKQLDENYGSFIGREKRLKKSGTSGDTAGTTGGVTTTTNVTSSTMGGAIDLGTVVKATRTMAGEIKLSRLLGTMMEIVLENAGARRGFLFLEREGELLLASRRDMDREVTETNDSRPLSEIEKQGGELAVSVIRYVARTKESVVISDAANDEKFSRDPYVSEFHPRSILCSPIVHQGHLTGILYLENNLSAGAFTPERLEVLNMLSSQAAVSLENAVLYDNMETKVEERTKEVRDILTNVNQGIFTINGAYCLTGGYSGLVPKIFEDIELTRNQPVKITELAEHPKLEEYLDMLFNSPYANLKMIESANPLKEYDYHYTNGEGKSALKKLSFSFSRIFEMDKEGNETKVIQKLMVVVGDKTEEFKLKKELEQKTQEQAGKVEKLYQILQLEPSIFSNFISESTETLNEVRGKLGELAQEPESNREVLRIIFREVHTLKGNARALSLDSIGKTAHELEDVFEELKEDPEKITQELKDKTYAAVAMLKDEIQDGNSLFEKILNMQNSLKSAPKDAMGEFEERFRKIIERESNELGKKIDFEFLNELKDHPEDVLLKKIRDPLSHIIRNSVNHGIEDAAQRKELKKPGNGKIKLRLSTNESNLIIVCEDDGSGLDKEKIKDKAERLKLFSSEELAGMSDNDVYKLIFSSGLSTRDDVTDSAGRGVGMDAVKEDFKSLKAVVSLRNRPTQGLRFTIRIPDVLE